jgi:DNA primase
VAQSKVRDSDDNYPLGRPGPCTRLDQLEETHKARLYLKSRHFDPDFLGRLYHVSFCRDSHYWLAADRIIIPIYWDGKMRGWQARYVGELNWKGKAPGEHLEPKYFNCPGMPRNSVLYDFHRAKQYRTGVVVKGALDKIRFGGPATATLGTTMTPEQRHTFVKVFGKPDRNVVLLWDPDVYESEATQELAAYLKANCSGGFANVKLPEGTDPARFERGFLRAYVTREAKEQGVKVDFEPIQGSESN